MSYFLIQSPSLSYLLIALKAVGLVYRPFTLYFSTIAHKAPEFGSVGFPQYKTVVAPQFMNSIQTNKQMDHDNQKQPDINETRNTQFYFSQVQYLQRRVYNITCQLKLPLNYIFPSDFERKYEQAKNSQQIDRNWIQNYKQVVAYMIQGQINTTLMGLSQRLLHQFGGQILFWVDMICSFAQNQKYQQNFRMWQVIDVYKNCLHLQKGQCQKNRKFRRFAKSDIQATKKLINSINQLKLSSQSQSSPSKNYQQVLSKVQLAYKAYREANRKLVQFLSSYDQKKANLQFFQPGKSMFAIKNQNRQASNSQTKMINSRNKSINSRNKNIDNLKQYNPLKQKMITDFSVQLHKNKNAQLLRKIQYEKQNIVFKKQKTLYLDQLFKDLSNNKDSLNELRKSLKQNKSDYFKKLSPHHTTMMLYDAYFWLEGFLVPVQQFDLSRPFEVRNMINYQNSEYEQFQDLIGDDLYGNDYFSDQESQQQSLDSQEQRAIFQYGDAYHEDQAQKQFHQKATRWNKQFQGNQWILNYKDLEPLQFVYPNQQIHPEPLQVLKLIGQTTILSTQPFPMTLQETEQTSFNSAQLSKLRLIVHGRSYNQILQIIEQDIQLKQAFPKSKVNQFVGKYTKKQNKNVNGKRINIYLIVDFQNKQIINQENVKLDQNQRMVNLYELETDLQQSKVQPQQIGMQSNCMSGQNHAFCSKQSCNTKVLPQNLSNQISFSNQQKTKRNSGSQRSAIDLSNNLLAASSRLRQRKSKPNYNINSLLGRNCGKKLSSSDLEI